MSLRRVVHHPAAGGAADAWLRRRIHGGRRTWAFVAPGYFIAFESFAPYAILARRGAVRMLEGVAFAVVATLVTWALRRSRAPRA